MLCVDVGESQQNLARERVYKLQGIRQLQTVIWQQGKRLLVARLFLPSLGIKA